MSDPTPVPTPPADPKASPAPPAPAPEPPGDPADLGEAGKKAIKAERDRAAAAEKANAALQKQLDDIAAANLSDLEKAQLEAKDAREAAATATAEALRLRVAAKHGISDEDADLFLTGSDAETVEKQAAALVARTSTSPKPDLTQGPKGTPAGTSPAQDFASFLNAQMS